MRLTPPSPALLPVLLLLGALGSGSPLATAAPSSGAPPPPANPVPIEIDPDAQACAGLWAQECAEGMRCVDNPADSCDRANGDTDCPGLCVSTDSTPIPAFCRRLDATRRYVSHAPSLCALVLFSCGVGEQPFFDACGCGCERTL